MRGFERAHSSQAGDEGTTTVEQYDWADRPQADGVRAGGPRAVEVWADGPRADGPQADGVWADGPQEELSPGNRVWADRAKQLQMEEDLANPPTDRGTSHGSACRPTVFLVWYLTGH